MILQNTDVTPLCHAAIDQIIRPLEYSDVFTKHDSFGPDGIAEWSKALDRFEWRALANSRVEVSDYPSILPGLGGYPGRPNINVRDCLLLYNPQT